MVVSKNLIWLNLRSSRKLRIVVALILVSIWLLTLLSSPVKAGGDGDAQLSIPLKHQLVTKTSLDRPLILYAYSESSWARENLEFFITHGLHAAADFIFVFNGETNATQLLPNRSNIQYVTRENTCYDLGAHAEVLIKDNLWKRYERFILLNASIRGPFIPYWASSCWSERYLSKVTEEVKLVGMTMNCWPHPHIQSMIWATDAIGMGLLLYPPVSTPNHAEWIERMPVVAGWRDTKKENAPLGPVPGINSCFSTYYAAIEAEVGASSIIRGEGYKVDAMMTRFHADPDHMENCDTHHSEDLLYDRGYDGVNLHPYETIFMKSNRGIDPLLLKRLSNWTDGAKYSSYDFC